MPENTEQQPELRPEPPKTPRPTRQEVEEAYELLAGLKMPSGRVLLDELRWLQVENYLRMTDVRAHERRIVELERQRDDARRERDSALADFKNAQNGCDALLRECDEKERARCLAIHERDQGAIQAQNLAAEVRRLESVETELREDVKTLQRQIRERDEREVNTARLFTPDQRPGDPGYVGPKFIHVEDWRNRIANRIANLEFAFSTLVDQMNSTSGFDPAVLRARLAGEK